MDDDEVNSPDSPGPDSLGLDSLGLDSLGPVPSLPGGGTPVRAVISFNDLKAGQVVLDFQIQEVLGRGAFGTVYLALQLSLNRFVALKAGMDVGAEGRTMARLQHPNIVQVYAEQVVPEANIRLLCMQFVPGPSLQSVLDEFRNRQRPTGWNGRELLEMIDQMRRGPSLLDLREVDDRKRLETFSFLECVCYLGAELAHGLQHAHRQDVLHRDIKPANVLMNAYGRPLLADFNLSETSQASGPEQLVGGTLAYMSPEHLAAFRDSARSDQRQVDARSDLYSLTLLLIQLLTGQVPIPETAIESTASDSENDEVRQRRFVEALLKERQQPLCCDCWISLEIQRTTPAAAQSLTEVLLRGTQPDPSQRTLEAKILREELLGCQRLFGIQRDERREQLPLKLARRFPLAAFTLLALIPHVVGSVVNISYNMMRVGELPRIPRSTISSSDGHTIVMAAQEAITKWYNVIAWPFCIVLILLVIRANLRALQCVPEPAETLERSSRRRLAALPRSLAIVAAIGWVPGLLVFPAGLYLLADVHPVSALTHFATNLLMSGSIALSYSYVGVTWLVLWVLYPRLWRFPAGLIRDDGREEIRILTEPLRWCRTMAGLIPLLSAVLIVVIGPSEFSSTEYAGFRILLTLLISLGMLGYHVSSRLVERLYERGRQYWT